GVERVHLVFRRLYRDVIGDPIGRVGPEVGRHLLGRAQARIDIVADVARGDAELQGPRPVDLDVEIRGVDLLLEMGVGDTWDRRYAAAQLFGNAQVLDPIITDGADVDLRGEAEIQDLGSHICGLEVEQIRRERRRQNFSQLAN